jgi:LAO/AO transport system kinase
MSSPLTEQVLDGHRRAVARLITQVENQHPAAQAVLNEIYPHTGQAHLVGVTGAPGTGKSSLVNKLVKAYRSRQNNRVAVLAVDPTSPFSGGAILGDRIRMRELSGDPGVFIRSMASRGSLGGLAQPVDDAVKVLDAAGFDVIFVETVGAGQGEVEIAKTAQTVIVVEAPGLGDDVQAIKAGILEIADIFVVNKADRPGSERTVAALRMMLELGHAPAHHLLHHGQLMLVDEAPAAATPANDGPQQEDGWEIPVLKTMALKGEGIEPVVAAIDQHHQYLWQSGELVNRNRARLMDELETNLQTELMKQLLHKLPPNYVSEIIAKLVDRSLTPHTAVQKILGEFSQSIGRGDQ